MKPDPKHAKDRQRLDDKKAKKAAARQQRQADAAVAADQTVSPEARQAADDIKRLRGANRAGAFATLAAIDRAHAVNVVRALAREADGKNLTELGALLIARGDDDVVGAVVDAALAGRYGDLVVADLRPGCVGDALLRLDTRRRHLSPTALGQHLVRLGLVPWRPGLVQGRVLEPFLTALVDDAPLWSALGPDVTDAIIDGLVEVAPAAVWARRDVLAGDPRVTVAAIACGGDIGDGVTAADALTTWLATRTPEEQSLRLRQAGLPRTNASWAVPATAALLRAVFLDELAGDERRAEAARSLWRLVGLDALHTLLLFPRIAVDVSLAIWRTIDFDEAWPGIAEVFTVDVAVRDGLLGCAHGRQPALLDRLLTLTTDDPIGVGAMLAINEAPQALDVLCHAIDTADEAVARGLLIGALSTAARTGTSLSPLRTADRRKQLLQMLVLTEGGVDVGIGITALRRFRVRVHGSEGLAIDDAIDRIGRRYALAR